MQQIAKDGSVIRGWVGIEAQDITAELAESFKLPKSEGALIAGVLRDSPADKAGLKSGDVLISINNQKVVDSASMLNIIAMLKPNEKATLDIVRDGKNMVVNVLIGKRPKMVTTQH
jgi:serine protease DegQ